MSNADSASPLRSSKLQTSNMSCSNRYKAHPTTPRSSSTVVRRDLLLPFFNHERASGMLWLQRLLTLRRWATPIYGTVPERTTRTLP